jgi:hypothetical protein
MLKKYSQHLSWHGLYLSLGFLIMFISLFLTLTAIGCNRPSLSAEDNESNTHLVNALNGKNQFIIWMNSIAGLSENDRPSYDEWNLNLEVLKKSIYEAKQVSQDFMFRVHVDLPDRWNNYLIPSMEKTYSYYATAINNPSSIKLPSTTEGMQQVQVLYEAKRLEDIWSDWYDQNRDAIRAGIRKMAK